jgi:hypothetical protein
MHNLDRTQIGRACISPKVTVEHVHELGKGEQHVEGEPAHAGDSVERLGDRHEVLIDPVLVE